MIEDVGSVALIRWIPILPLVGTLIQATMLFVARRSARRTWVTLLTMLPVTFSFLFACAAFAELIDLPIGSRIQIDSLWSWVGLGVGDETFSAEVAFRFDPLAGTFALAVLAVSIPVFVYGLALMERDDRPDAGYQRFFTYLSFVLSSALILVLADNLLILLVGWIATGLGSALLIGFWYSEPGGSRAAVRSVTLSFATDSILLACFVGFFWSLASVGPYTTSLTDVQAALPELKDMTVSLPFGIEAKTLHVLAFGIAFAACGRSAQLPFTFALSGVARSPAPAAAMSILTASMGIYLCCRFSFLYTGAAEVSSAIAWAGAVTALIAAASALAQRDLVAILVAIAVTQFGFAFVAIGAGVYSAAIFQVLITVVVLSLLILCAGSVIDGLDGERDIRRMGGLNVRLVVTHLMVAVGTLSPALFLAREQAIASAFGATHVAGSRVVFGLSLIATLLVSWAISRFLVGVFWGSIRTPLGFRGEFSDPPIGFMIPVYALAFLSLLLVALNPAQIWGDLMLGGVDESDSLQRFLGGVLARSDGDVIGSGLRWQLVASSCLATLIGFSTTYLFYIRFPARRVKVNARLSPVQQVLEGHDVGGILERRVANPLIATSRLVFEQNFSVANVVRRLRSERLSRLARSFFGGRGRSEPSESSRFSLLLVLAGALWLLVVASR